MAKDIARYTDRQMMKDFDRMLDSFFGHADRMPSVDIRQDKDSYVVRARVAGYRPDELNAYVEDHVLHIVGRRARRETGSTSPANAEARASRGASRCPRTPTSRGWRRAAGRVCWSWWCRRRRRPSPEG